MAQRLLFGGTQGSSSQSKYLVEFKAGKCTQKGKLVTPDKRKGKPNSTTRKRERIPPNFRDAVQCVVDSYHSSSVEDQ